MRAGRLQRRRRVRRRRLRERPARVRDAPATPSRTRLLDAQRPDRRVRAATATTTATATSTTSPAGTSSTTTTTRTTRRATRAPPTTAPAGPRRRARRRTKARAGRASAPRCQIVPLRVVGHVRGRRQQLRARPSLYAADNDIEVVEGAIGGLFNSRFAAPAFEQAYRKGVFLAIVSSDLNTADHNIPTALRRGDAGAGQRRPTSRASVRAAPRVGALPRRPRASRRRRPIGTWFRNSGTTQYGGHAHVVDAGGHRLAGHRPGGGRRRAWWRRSGARRPGSAARAERDQAAAHAHRGGRGAAEHRSALGVPDPAQVGWDQHFGYGRPDLGLALERIDQGKIPPQALITAPDWFAPLNLAQQRRRSRSAAGSPRSARPATRGSSSGRPASSRRRPTSRTSSTQSATTPDRRRARHDRPHRRARRARRAARRRRHHRPDRARQGSRATRTRTSPPSPCAWWSPTPPATAARTARCCSPTATPRSTRAGRDAPGTRRRGLPAAVRPDGDNELDIVQADSSGELNVLKARRHAARQPSTAASRCRTQAVRERAPGRALLRPGGRRRARSLRTPAIGDIDGDLEPEIVDSAGEHVYAWNGDGSVGPGLPGPARPGQVAPRRCARARTTSSAASSPRPRSAT